MANEIPQTQVVTTVAPAPDSAPIDMAPAPATVVAPVPMAAPVQAIETTPLQLTCQKGKFTAIARVVYDPASDKLCGEMVLCGKEGTPVFKGPVCVPLEPIRRELAKMHTVPVQISGRTVMLPAALAATLGKKGMARVQANASKKGIQVNVPGKKFAPRVSNISAMSPRAVAPNRGAIVDSQQTQTQAAMALRQEQARRQAELAAQAQPMQPIQPAYGPPPAGGYPGYPPQGDPYGGYGGGYGGGGGGYGGGGGGGGGYPPDQGYQQDPGAGMYGPQGDYYVGPDDPVYSDAGQTLDPEPGYSEGYDPVTDDGDEFASEEAIMGLWSSLKNAGKKLANKVGVKQLYRTIEKVVDNPALVGVFPALGVSYKAIREGTNLLAKAKKGDPKADAQLKDLAVRARAGDPQAEKGVEILSALYKGINDGLDLEGWAKEKEAESNITIAEISGVPVVGAAYPWEE